jgi:hypothetical protein
MIASVSGDPNTGWPVKGDNRQAMQLIPGNLNAGGPNAGLDLATTDKLVVAVGTLPDSMTP